MLYQVLGLPSHVVDAEVCLSTQVDLLAQSLTRVLWMQWHVETMLLTPSETC